MNDHECLSDLKSESAISEDHEITNLEKIFKILDEKPLYQRKWNEEKKWFRNINFIKWAF